MSEGVAVTEIGLVSKGRPAGDESAAIVPTALGYRLKIREGGVVLSVEMTVPVPQERAQQALAEISQYRRDQCPSVREIERLMPEALTEILARWGWPIS